MPSGTSFRYLIKSVSIVLFLLASVEMNAQSQSHSKDSLIVSFISIGAGTDYKAHEKLDLFVQDFQSKQHLQLNVTIKHWGREGETDYIYDLSTLSKKQCKAFVEEIVKLFAMNNLVKISHSLVE